jgi:flagellar biosynthesis protein FlhG
LTIRRRPDGSDDPTDAPPPVEPPRQIWAVGGGKGGIGKTFVTANLGTIAALGGKQVVLVDLDLGGANLHTCLGVRGAARTNLGDWLEDRVPDLEKVAIETPIPRLRLILGALGQAAAPEANQARRAQLLDSLRRLSADVIVLDLAAGTDRATLDFFLVSDTSFVVTTPEPTAIENAYSFLRGAFYRRLSQAMLTSPVRDLVREGMTTRNERGIRTPADLLDEIERVDAEEAARFRRILEEFRPRLILNQVRSQEDIKIGFSIQSVVRKYFGFGLEYVGYVNFDDAVWRSVKASRPLVLAHPQSDGALYMRRIVKKVLEG